MTCRTDECRQGRKPCPTPDECTDWNAAANLFPSDPVGYEAAFPVEMYDPPKKPLDLFAIGKWIAVVLLFGGLMYLSIGA